MTKAKRRAMGSRRKLPPRRARSGAEARFRSVFDLSRGFYWESDAEHRIIEVVHGSRYVLTFAPGSQIGKTRWEIPSSKPDAAGWAAHKATLDAHLPFRDFESVRIGPDGAERHFELSGEPVFDAKRRFTGYRGIGRDVTERKQSEEALRESEERNRSLLTASPDGIWIHRNPRVEYVNDALVTMLGYKSADEIVGREIYEMLPPEHREAVRERLERLTTERPAAPLGEFAMLKRDGAVLDVEVASASFRQKDAVWIITIIRDITERKRAERMLRLEHTVPSCLADADSAAEALKAVIRAVCETENWECGRYFFVDDKAGVLRCSEFWSVPDEAVQRFITESLGLVFAPGAGLLGKVWQSEQPLWVADIFQDDRATQQVLTLGSGIHGAFAFTVKSEGKTIGVLTFNSRQIREPDERLLQAAGAIGSQVGQFLQRKQAEEALRESEVRFRNLTELSSDWYWEQDTDFRFTRFEGLRGTGNAGSPRLDYLGKQHWETGLEVEGGWESHRALLQAHGPFRDIVMYRLIGPGSPRYFVMSGEPMFDREGRFAGYRGLTRDVTESKRAEQLQKLEHTVARAIDGAESISAALKAAMRAVCETENWECARYFQVDDKAGVLRFAESWNAPIAAAERFVTGSRNLVYGPGVGLTGAVWQSGKPHWVADVTQDGRASGAGLAHETGIRGTFMFPVTSEGKTLGVLGFFSRHIREPDARLLETIHVIGSQIGQFLHRKQAEQALRESEERFRNLTQMSSDFFWESDREHRLTRLVLGPMVSPRRFPGSPIGRTPWEMASVKPDAAGWAALEAKMNARVPFHDFEYARCAKDGAIRHFSVSGEPRLAPDGEYVGYRGVGREITELVNARERIAALAFSDALTGLANRASLGPALEHAVQLARRHDRKLAIMFVDLDGFKQINDAHGHDTGDRLLIEVANRLRACLRTSDLLARLGGDEFIVVLEEVRDTDYVEGVARRLLDAIARPYSLVAGEESRVTASIGISMLPDDAGDPRTLMKHADTAMYRAKQCGKNRHRFFGSESTGSSKPGATG